MRPTLSVDPTVAEKRSVLCGAWGVAYSAKLGALLREPESTMDKAINSYPEPIKSQNTIKELRRIFDSSAPYNFKLPDHISSDFLQITSNAPSSVAKSSELLAYKELSENRPALALTAFRKACHHYKLIRRPEDALVVNDFAEILFNAHFTVYHNDFELLEDIYSWARLQMIAIYYTQPASDPNPDINYPQQASELKTRWKLRFVATRNKGITLNIDVFVQRLGLNSLDTDLLLLLLAVDDNVEFHGLRRELVNNDDFYTAGLILQLLSEDKQSMQSYIERIESRSPLNRHRLIYLNTPIGRRGTGLHNHLIELDDSASGFVCGRDFWPSGIDSITTFYPPKNRPGQAYFTNKLEKLNKAINYKEGGIVILCGVTRETNLALALTWASLHKQSLMEIDVHSCFNDPAVFENVFRIIIREALLRNSVLLINSNRQWAKEEPSDIINSNPLQAELQE